MRNTASFYVVHKQKLLKGLAGSILTDHIPRVLESTYGKETADRVMRGTGKNSIPMWRICRTPGMRTCTTPRI